MMACASVSGVKSYAFSYCFKCYILRKSAPLLGTCVVQLRHYQFKVRPMSKKHWKPEFKKLRAQKVIKIELPDFDKIRREKKLSIEELRTEMKKEGIQPHAPYEERPILITSTGSIFEPYVPPEGDGRSSIISLEGVKDQAKTAQMKGRSALAIRKIRQYEEDFNSKDFAVRAQEMFIEINQTLEKLTRTYIREGNMDLYVDDKVRKIEDKLHDLVTEKAYPDLTHQLKNKIIKWQWVESLVPPKVTHVRQTEMISKANVYGQVTVRMHSKQILTIYDRFGRLIYGSETMPKDVLEYIVFEKHLSNQYGVWRLHGKIRPEWMPAGSPILRTFVRPNIVIPEEEVKEETGLTETQTAEVNPS